MNVGELKKMLDKYPDDMDIVTTRYSDYAIVNEDEWTVIKGVEKTFWVMRSHSTMSEANKDAEKVYLLLEKNT